MRRSLSCLLAVPILAFAPSTGSGQSHRITGISVERFYVGDGRFTAVDFRFTRLDHRRSGLDLNLGLVPVALQGGLVVLDLDFGAAQGLAIGPATLLLKGGAGTFLALGLHAEREFYPGLQAGLAALVPVQRQLALRLDLSRRVYFPAGGSFQMWSAGVGFAVVRALPIRQSGRTVARFRVPTTLPEDP
jgi:hypothetical protein